MQKKPYLVGDLGATNVRFALISEHDAAHVAELSCADFDSLQGAIAAYRDRVPEAQAARQAALAVASPISGDRVTLTNRAWSFSIDDLRRSQALERLEVVNDFVAVAASIPHLQPADRMPIGGGTPRPGPIGVLGPGSGLGMGSLIPTGTGDFVPVPGEGGHATAPATTDREAAVISLLRTRYRHVSCERLLSGMGLVNLYEAIGALDGQADGPTLEPAQISAAAAAGDGPAREAVGMFAGLLGTVAGNLALTVGARAGIFVAGGIVPRLGPLFDRDLFRTRFEAKGRFEGYLSEIPTFLVTRPLPAFLGLRGLLDRAVAPR